MEPWMINMLGSNAGGSHDLHMLGSNVGGPHDVEVAETQYGSPQEEQEYREAALGEGSTGVKGNKKRSKNFSVQEDNLLVAAWLEISMDAVQRIDQPRATYWERIHEHYHLHKDFETDRNCGSLAHRWGIILETVYKFCSWYGHVQRRQESGLTEQDRVLVLGRNISSYCQAGTSCSSQMLPISDRCHLQGSTPLNNYGR